MADRFIGYALRNYGLCNAGWWQKLLGARQHVGYMAQGEQRTLDNTGRVIPAKLPSQHIQVILLPLACEHGGISGSKLH